MNMKLSKLTNLSKIALVEEGSFEDLDLAATILL